MEAALVLSLAALALLVWRTMELNEKIEHVDARLVNQLRMLDKQYKMLEDLQPKEPFEIPVRLDTETLKQVMPGLYDNEEMLKKWRRNSSAMVFKPEEGDIKFGELWEYDAPEPNEVLKKGAGYYKKKVLTENEKNVLETLYGKKDKQQNAILEMMDEDENDNQYGNEGYTLEDVNEKQKNEIRENVRERKKRSLNK